MQTEGGNITSWGGRSGAAAMRESELEKTILWRRSGTEVRGELEEVSSLNVRKAVLHERTGGCRAEAEDDAAISAVRDHGGGGRLTITLI